MKWVIVREATADWPATYGHIDDDGLMRVTCVAEHPEFVAWLAEGNEPEVVG